MLNIVVAEIDKYVEEKIDFIVPLLKKGSHNLICANTGTGKALKNGTGVSTDKGYIPIEKLNINDKIFGEDGKLYKVIGVFPQGKKEIYKIEFSDGSIIEASGDHLWNFQTAGQRASKRGHWHTKTTKEILENFELFKIQGGKKKWNIYIPMTKPLDFPYQEVSIPPYTLGALLGDGTLALAKIAFSSNDIEIIEKVNSEIAQFGRILKHSSGPDYRVSSFESGGGYKSPLTSHLKELKLTDTKSNNKFIPNIYKYNSVEIRLEVLKGLIDTDGYADKSFYEYTTVSKQLAEDVKFLAESLGMTVNVATKQGSYRIDGVKRECQLVYRLTIKTTKEIPLINYLPRKNIKLNQTSARRTIRSIIPTGIFAEMTCIKTSNPTELFLTENCIVTHNTTMALNLAKTVKNTILLSPTTVIVDQFIQNAKEEGLTVVDKNQIEDWAFGEVQIGDSKIWIGTFSALKHQQPNWDVADYVFFDEIHFLLDLSVFGKETALEVWDIIQKTQNYPNTIFVSLTANDELVLPLSGIFNFHKIFIVKSEKWRLAPNKILIYPTISGMNNIDFVLHYCANYVAPDEKVLCVVKSYKELDQIREQVSKLPNDVEVISAKDKKTSETYWSICLKGSIPTEIRLVVATTWISLGASILDASVRHVISTFPNFSLTKQILSRIRTGSVNVAIMQLLHPRKHEEGLEFNNLQDLLMKSKTSKDLFSEVFVTHNGERIWFPLPIISKIYQTEQEQVFADLDRLKLNMSENLDCKVEVMWEPLLKLRDQCLTAVQIEQAFKMSKRLHFPVNTLIQFKKALRINTV